MTVTLPPERVPVICTDIDGEGVGVGVGVGAGDGVGVGVGVGDGVGVTPVGVTGVLGSDGSPHPAAFRARTVNVYIGDSGADMVVTLVENLGADTFVYGTITDGNGKETTLVSRGQALPHIGETVKVTPTHTYVFDIEGNRPRLS